MRSGRATRSPLGVVVVSAVPEAPMVAELPVLPAAVLPVLPAVPAAVLGVAGLLPEAPIVLLLPGVALGLLVEGSEVALGEPAPVAAPPGVPLPVALPAVCATAKPPKASAATAASVVRVFLCAFIFELLIGSP